jgi:glycosyltransferase involved in cell wall biosynthesis
VSGAVLGRLASMRYGAPLAVVFQDLAGIGSLQSGAAGTWTARAVSAAEAFAARGAAAAGVVASGFGPRVRAMGVPAGRIHHLRNWSSLASPDMDPTSARRMLGVGAEDVLCVHAGNMGAKQGLDNVLECARLSSTQAPQLTFAFVGDGSHRRRLEERASAMGLRNVRFVRPMPEGRFASVLASANVLLLNQRSSVTDMALPSKLTAYFASGTPVVAAVSARSEAAAEVEASGGGLLVPAEDPGALLEGIVALSSAPSLGATLAANARAWSHNVLSRPAALRGYDDLLARTLGGSTAQRRGGHGSAGGTELNSREQEDCDERDTRLAA